MRRNGGKQINRARVVNGSMGRFLRTMSVFLAEDHSRAMELVRERNKLYAEGAAKRWADPAYRTRVVAAIRLAAQRRRGLV